VEDSTLGSRRSAEMKPTAAPTTVKDGDNHPRAERLIEALQRWPDALRESSPVALIDPWLKSLSATA
jgi:hypothetical protein